MVFKCWCGIIGDFEMKNEKFGNKWIDHGRPRQWPHRSPDLTLDFFMGICKGQSYV